MENTNRLCRQRAGRLTGIQRHIRKYWMLHLMAMPVVCCLLIFNYLPMLGLVVAFKQVDFSLGIFRSPWVGFRNFEFLFTTEDAWVITRNTILYNLVFIVLNMFLAVSLALLLNEIYSRLLAKALQTVFMMPHFLSMAVVAIIVFAFLSPSNGLINEVRASMGLDAVNWYMFRSVWPPLLVFVNAWKHIGYSAVVYTAAITGISSEYYEAAMLDGATKGQQAWYITIPYLKPMISIMLIMSLGNIFRGDFGLFYNVTQNNGMLYPVTDVIDTYIYRALTTLNNTGMGTAAGLYQSLIGFILVMIANRIVTKINPDSALF